MTATPEQLDAHRLLVLEEVAGHLDQCLTCGAIHQPHPDPNRPELAPSWAAADGHPYRPRNRSAAAAIRRYADHAGS